MSLSSLQLDAFLEVARTRNFSRAAKHLGLTQPALSQRILNLESELEAALLVREPSGIRLTERGEDLLRYCQTRESLERDLLARWKTTDRTQLAGVVRLAGFSTVMRSVALPALAGLARQHPALQLELKTAEIRELPALLRSGEVDFILLDQDVSRSDLRSHLLGREEYVLVESATRPAPENTFLDNDAEDDTTRSFFRANRRSGNRWRRSYLDEIYGLIDGVALGLGRAVIPRHLLRERSDLREIPGYQSLRTDVFLQYYEQPFYSRVHQAVVDTFLAESPRLLGG